MRLWKGGGGGGGGGGGRHHLVPKGVWPWHAHDYKSILHGT